MLYAQPEVRLDIINVLCQALDMSAIIRRVKACQACHYISGGISGKPLVVIHIRGDANIS